MSRMIEKNNIVKRKIENLFKLKLFVLVLSDVIIMFIVFYRPEMNHINDILNSNQISKVNFSKIIFFNDLKNKIQKALRLENTSIVALFFGKNNTIIINCKSNTIKNFIMNKINIVKSIIPKKYKDKNIKIKVYLKN